MAYQQQSGYAQTSQPYVPPPPAGFQPQTSAQGGQHYKPAPAQQQHYGPAPAQQQQYGQTGQQAQYGAAPGGVQHQPSYAAAPQQHTSAYAAAPMVRPQAPYVHPQSYHAAPAVTSSTVPQPYVATQAYGTVSQKHSFLGEQFVVQGQPLLLILTEKKLSLGGDSTVTDQNGSVLFKFDGKALSLKDKRVLRDKNGLILATMHQKLFGKHTWVISRGNGGPEVCTVQQDDAGSIGAANIYVGAKKKFGVSTADYIIRVQASGKDIQITTKAGQLLAETSKTNTKIGGLLNADRYGVVVQPGVDMAWVLCVLTAMDDMTFKK